MNLNLKKSHNACGAKNYLHPHRHLHHKTMQNSKKPAKTYVSVFFHFFSSCFRFLPHFLMNFPLFRLHEVATLATLQNLDNSTRDRNGANFLLPASSRLEKTSHRPDSLRAESLFCSLARLDPKKTGLSFFVLALPNIRLTDRMFGMKTWQMFGMKNAGCSE